MNTERVQVILDEGVTRRNREVACSNGEGGAHSAGAAPLLSGSEAAALMKIGVRVLRGPDWKWGDQVVRNLLLYSIDFSRPLNCSADPQPAKPIASRT